MEKLIAEKQEPYFLALFGFDTWEKVREIGTKYPWRRVLR